MKVRVFTMPNNTIATASGIASISKYADKELEATEIDMPEQFNEEFTLDPSQFAVTRGAEGFQLEKVDFQPVEVSVEPISTELDTNNL